MPHLAERVGRFFVAKVIVWLAVCVNTKPEVAWLGLLIALTIAVAPTFGPSSASAGPALGPGQGWRRLWATAWPWAVVSALALGSNLLSADF